MEEQRLNITELLFAREEIYLQLGYKGEKPQREIVEQVEALIERLKKVCEPLYAFHLVPAELLDRKRIRIGEVFFEPGGIIASYMKGCEEVALFITTAGKEFDDFLRKVKNKGDIVEEFIVDALGSYVAEAVVGEVRKRIEDVARQKGEIVSNPYSPGYCGWNVQEQQKLFSLLPDGTCGVKLTESCLMHPIKSVSGIFAMGRELVKKPYACEICRKKDCYKRKIK